jgi:hypothetical protein
MTFRFETRELCSDSSLLWSWVNSLNLKQMPSLAYAFLLTLLDEAFASIEPGSCTIGTLDRLAAPRLHSTAFPLAVGQRQRKKDLAYQASMQCFS